VEVRKEEVFLPLLYFCLDLTLENALSEDLIFFISQQRLVRSLFLWYLFKLWKRKVEINDPFFFWELCTYGKN